MIRLSDFLRYLDSGTIPAIKKNLDLSLILIGSIAIVSFGLLGRGWP